MRTSEGSTEESGSAEGAQPSAAIFVVARRSPAGVAVRCPPPHALRSATPTIMPHSATSSRPFTVHTPRVPSPATVPQVYTRPLPPRFTPKNTSCSAQTVQHGHRMQEEGDEIARERERIRQMPRFDVLEDRERRAIRL